MLTKPPSDGPRANFANSHCLTVLPGRLLPAAADPVVARLGNRSAHRPGHCSNWPNLCDTAIAVFVFLLLGGISCSYAEGSNSTATSNAATPKLFINPSSTSVPFRGKASLIVSPLTHRNGNYVGDYKLKVRPYYFKSEKGSLLLVASDDVVRKLQTGIAIDFSGKAVTYQDGRTHIVLGRVTPSSADRGSVTFSIITDDGKIVFKTSYHFES
jgi:hypothetical protein